jgi:hypothetical protein
MKTRKNQLQKKKAIRLGRTKAPDTERKQLKIRESV